MFDRAVLPLLRRPNSGAAATSPKPLTRLVSRVGVLRGGLSVALALALVGCPDDETGEAQTTPPSLETTLSADAIAAGATIDVTCTRSPGETVLGAAEATLSIAPETGWSLQEHRLTVTGAGSYTIACQAGELVDESPETLTVTAGAPTTAGPWIDPANGTAGVTASAGCRVADEFGNPLDGYEGTLEVQPNEGVTVADGSVTATLMGTYTVSCSFAADPGVTSSPIQWPVSPGPASRLVLRLDPDQAAYPIKTKIVVTADSYDAHGNPVGKDVTLDDLTLAPDAPFSVTLPEFSVGAAGDYVLTGHAGDATGTIDLPVDGQKPGITVGYPERGLTHGHDPELLVTGSGTDERKLSRIRINGTSVPFDEATGGFTTKWPLTYGVNTLHSEAEDEAGNVGETWRAAAWSPKWYALAPASSQTDGVDGGLTIALGPEVLDDGDHDEASVDDMATLVETVLAGLDFQTLVPDPLGSFLGCDYHMQEFSIDDAEVSLSLADGALLMNLRFTDFVLRVRNSGGILCSFHDGKEDGDWTNGTGPLQYLADAITVKAELTLKVVDGELIPSINITKIDSEGTYNVNIPVITDIVDGFFNFFLGILKGVIADQLNNVFADLIGSFALDLPLELPALGDGDPSLLRLVAKPTSGHISADAMVIGLRTLAHADDPKRPHEVLGSMGYAGCGPTAELPAPGWPMMMALHDDVLNQILFAVWDGGLLNQSLGAEALGDFDLSQYGISDLDIILDARLPLIYNSCGTTDANPNQRIQIGDLYMEATFNFGDTPTHIAFWIQGEAPVEFAVVTKEDGTSELGFALQDLDPLVLEIAINDGFFADNEDLLIGIVKGQLLPQMLGALAGGLGSFPLPEVELSSLIDGLPEGLSLGLDVKSIATGGGTVRLHAGLK